MIIDKNTGLLAQAEFIESANHDARPDPDDISLLVIHNISLPPDQFGSGDITRLFTNCLDCSTHPYYQQLVGLQVSSHLLLERNGDIKQFVPFHKRAWHAGVSSYNGRQRCNDFSIGIELEGTDNLPYEDRQYEQLFVIIKALLHYYPNLHPDRIVGHCDIAPGRKTDPGPAFNWDYLYQALKE